MIERTTVRLPQDLLSRAKRKAAAEGRTLTVADRGWAAAGGGRERKATEAQARCCPSAQATGGYAGDRYHATFAALQEMEDLEYVERMKHFK